MAKAASPRKPRIPILLTDPARYAKIPYRQNHLTVLHMNGLQLDFPANYFDFAFSFSSIEHFGGREAAAQSVREMGPCDQAGRRCDFNFPK